jgi:hypothetical protein
MTNPVLLIRLRLKPRRERRQEERDALKSAKVNAQK